MKLLVTRHDDLLHPLLKMGTIKWFNMRANAVRIEISYVLLKQLDRMNEPSH